MSLQLQLLWTKYSIWTPCESTAYRNRQADPDSHIGYPTSDVAQRAMREAAPHARGMGKLRQL
jgi:hypothetical protein